MAYVNCCSRELITAFNSLCAYATIRLKIFLRIFYSSIETGVPHPNDFDQSYFTIAATDNLIRLIKTL